jgi:hypothetical protein
MLTEIKKRLFGKPSRRPKATYENEWSLSARGPRWKLLKETDRGIKIEGTRVKKYTHMETGEKKTFKRSHPDTRWYEYENRSDWPEYIKTVEEKGVLFEEDGSGVKDDWVIGLSLEGHRWTEE